MFFGLLLIIVGVVFLLQNLGIVSGSVWNLIWPLIIMLLGISIILKTLFAPGYYGKRNKGGKKDTKN